jgi:hypothetical protein
LLSNVFFNTLKNAMKTFTCFRIGMIGMVALIALGFTTRSFAAIDAYLWITDSSGKITKVKIHHDGSFTTPALHAGTYRWSFGVTQSGVAASAGDNPKETIKLNFTKIGMTYTIQDPHDAATGIPTGKRMHKPFSIMKVLDKSSPKMMTNLGTIAIDANGETLSGTVTPMTTDGGKSAMDDWSQ